MEVQEQDKGKIAKMMDLCPQLPTVPTASFRIYVAMLSLVFTLIRIAFESRIYAQIRVYITVSNICFLISISLHIALRGPRASLDAPLKSNQPSQLTTPSLILSLLSILDELIHFDPLFFRNVDILQAKLTVVDNFRMRGSYFQKKQTSYVRECVDIIVCDPATPYFISFNIFRIQNFLLALV